MASAGADPADPRPRTRRLLGAWHVRRAALRHRLADGVGFACGPPPCAGHAQRPCRSRGRRSRACGACRRRGSELCPLAGHGPRPHCSERKRETGKSDSAFMAGLLVCEYGQCVMADGTSRRDSCEASPSSDAGDLRNSGSAADKSHPAVPMRHSARTDATKAARTCRARVRFSRKPRDPVAQGELKPGCTKATMKRPPAWAVTTHGREQGGVHGTGRALVHAGPQAQAGEERLARPGGPHWLRAHPRRAPGPCGPRRRRGWLRSAACRALVAAHTPCLPFVLHRPSRLSSHRFWTTWPWP